MPLCSTEMDMSPEFLLCSILSLKQMVFFNQVEKKLALIFKTFGNLVSNQSSKNHGAANLL